MKRALDLLDQLGDIVQRKPGLQITQITRCYLEEPPLRSDSPARQPSPQRFVHEVAKGPAVAARCRFELGRDIVVESQRRSHALMLYMRHHDVNMSGFRPMLRSFVPPNGAITPAGFWAR